jgi:tRNA(adenine34) deaminase
MQGRREREQVQRREEARMTSKKKWSGRVKTVSTFPPEGTFTKSAEEIARIMASKRVSPKGIGSGIRMVQFFINRAGKGLSAIRRRELERAKKLLQAKQHGKKTRGRKATRRAGR